MYFDLYNGLISLLPDSPKLKEVCENVEFIGCGASYISAELIKCMSDIFPHMDFVVSINSFMIAGW